MTNGLRNANHYGMAINGEVDQDDKDKFSQTPVKASQKYTCF